MLIDRFDRRIRYLRLSVTDRCDFRCTYCMAEDMTFLPRKDVLSLEELEQVAKVFVDLGVEKIRITGGEPLIRKNVMSLIFSLGKLPALKTLSLTTNGSHLREYAADLKAAGVSNINVSLDTLDAERFKQLTRFGQLEKVLDGIECARQQGFHSLKLNAVLLKNFNLDEACQLAEFALTRGIDLSFIEEMPLGEINSHSRQVEFVSSATVRDELAREFTLSEEIPKLHGLGGPAKYWRAQGYNSRIGFISPHSENFCADCNRVRVSAEGKLLLCLGNEDSLDLRSLLRSDTGNSHELVKQGIVSALDQKPEKHNFDLAQGPQILRFMNATGG